MKDHAPRSRNRKNANGQANAAWLWLLASLGAYGAGAVVIVFPTWSFAVGMFNYVTGVSKSVNILTSALVTIFAIVLGVYLIRQGTKFLRAYRDPFAREELLGELRPRSREMRYSLHLLRKSTLAMAGLVVIVVFVAIALLGPYIAPFPYAFSPYEKHVPPGGSALTTQSAPPGNSTSTTWVNGSAYLARSDSLYAQSNATGDALFLTNFTMPTPFPNAQAVDVGIDYYSPAADTVSIALSWNNGTSWTPEQLVPYKTTESGQLWYLSYGGDRAWTALDLNITNFVVRVTHVPGGSGVGGPLYLNQVLVRAVFIGPVHPWGTNELGQDVLTGILLGAMVDLRIGVLVVVTSVAVGIVLGVVAGYLGGWVDELVMRITDMFLAVPGLILAIAITAMLGRSLDNALIALVVVSWPSYTRLVRGQVLSIREVSYVEAARAVGAPTRRVMFRHILPNTLSPVIVASTLDLGTIVLSTAGLSFIGVAGQPTDPEWGVMISLGWVQMVGGLWWEYVIPGVAIFLFVLAFNLFGDGLRDILDPRLRR